MTPGEAKEFQGRRALFRNGGDPDRGFDLDSWRSTGIRPGRGTRKTLQVFPADLTAIPSETARLERRRANPLGAAQADLNEFAAAAIRAADLNPETAVKALRNLNWTTGFEFNGAAAPPAHQRLECAEAAIRAARRVKTMWEANGPG